MFLCFRS